MRITRACAITRTEGVCEEDRHAGINPLPAAAKLVELCAPVDEAIKSLHPGVALRTVLPASLKDRYLCLPRDGGVVCVKSGMMRAKVASGSRALRKALAPW